MRRTRGDCAHAAFAPRPPRRSPALSMAGDKLFTRKEVASGDSKSLRFIINNKVYDVSKFLDEHPGGHEVLENVAGKDASEDFEDVGHSLDAKELMAQYEVGALVAEDRREEAPARQVNWQAPPAAADDAGFLSSWKFPVLLGVLVTVLYSYLFG